MHEKKGKDPIGRTLRLGGAAHDEIAAKGVVAVQSVIIFSASLWETKTWFAHPMPLFSAINRGNQAGSMRNSLTQTASNLAFQTT